LEQHPALRNVDYYRADGSDKE
jgi:hypothetical protein